MAAIKAARDAGKLTGDRLKRLNDAMTALGPKPGEKGSDNGVTIGIGDVEGGVGQTLPEFTYNQADQSKDNYVAVAISVTFTEDFVKSDGLFAGLVHEGSHVFDQMEYANHPGTFFNSDNPFNLTKYQTETNAFQANSYLFEAMDVDGSKYDIPVWNKTWTQVDKNNPQVTADDRRASAIKEFVSSQYKVSGDMQGADFKSYGYKAKRIK
ncbi:MAG: hypothetical protein IPK58_12490 [Acidobacteria bacterium]|nr:hypothetical protein [Acidobacteriota bacterium]